MAGHTNWLLVELLRQIAEMYTQMNSIRHHKMNGFTQNAMMAQH
jgi:hypothetical protein